MLDTLYDDRSVEYLNVRHEQAAAFMADGLARVTDRPGVHNNCWGSEKAYQKHFYNERYIGCDIGNPRYDQFARLFGAAGYYVDHPDQVGDAIKAAIAADKPAIVEIPIDPNEFPTPVAAIRKT